MEFEDLEVSEKKESIVTPRCEIMLMEAVKFYIDKNLSEQAKNLTKKFKQIVKLLEIMPGIGTPWKNGIRTVLIRKFRYNIYYRENRDKIDVLGIWHTSRGSEFEEE